MTGGLGWFPSLWWSSLPFCVLLSHPCQRWHFPAPKNTSDQPILFPSNRPNSTARYIKKISWGDTTCLHIKDTSPKVDLHIHFIKLSDASWASCYAALSICFEPCILNVSTEVPQSSILPSLIQRAFLFEQEDKFPRLFPSAPWTYVPPDKGHFRLRRENLWEPFLRCC